MDSPSPHPSWHPALRPDSNATDNELAKWSSLKDGAMSDRSTSIVASGHLRSHDNRSSEEAVTTVLRHPPNKLNSFDNALGLQAVESAGILNGAKEQQPSRSDVTNPTSEGPLETAEDIGPYDIGSAYAQDVAGDERNIQPVVVAQSDVQASDSRKNPDAWVGGKDEMDGVWRAEEEIQKKNMLPAMERSNSFPEVFPPSNLDAVQYDMLSKSQAEEIVNEDSHIDAIEASANLAKTSNLQASSNADDSFGAIVDPADDDFFTNLESNKRNAGSFAVPEDQARYEEGLPLVAPAPDDEPQHLPSNGSNSSTGKGEQDEDEGFFDQSSSHVDIPKPSKRQLLDRKSTTQVLNSMHYAPHDVTHTPPETTEGRPSRADLTGGGIAVSASTVKAQVLPAQATDTAEPASKDEDLAERWKAALGEDDLLEDNDASLDPSSFFEDDGEGFLEDDPTQETHEGIMSETFSPPLAPVFGTDGRMQGFGNLNEGASTHQQYIPSTAPSTHQKRYDPVVQSQIAGGFSQAQQAMSIPSHSISAPPGFSGAPGPRTSTTNTSARPRMPESTPSFADKSKGGYTSPYDLPMEVSRPKKRTNFQQVHPSPDIQHHVSRPPPPRSSSMFTGAIPSSTSQPSPFTPPQLGSNTSLDSPANPTVRPPSSTSGFFEELPSTKPRPSSSMGKIIPPSLQANPPPPAMAHRQPKQEPPLDLQPRQDFMGRSQSYQLLPPEKLSLYDNPTDQQPRNQTVPVMNSRYSPAPPQQSNVPPPLNRYTSSPSSAPRHPPSQILPHQPRTSSPLTNHITMQNQSQSDSVQTSRSGRPGSSGLQGSVLPDSVPSQRSFPSNQGQQVTGSGVDQRQQTATSEKVSQDGELSPGSKSSRYAPLHLQSSKSPPTNDTREPDFLLSDPSHNRTQPQKLPNQYTLPTKAPPRRSQTQSPGVGKPNHDPPISIHNLYQRPASVNEHVSYVSSQGPSATVQSTERRGRGLSQSSVFIHPNDGREMDSLERWKGCPIVTFGFGGTMVTTFPKQIPRYAAGQKLPMIKCSPGEVKLENNRYLALDESITTFPGPLSSKGKKKEVVDWLKKRVSELEGKAFYDSHGPMLPDPRKRHEEKILLWKIVAILVEYDGIVEGSPTAEKAVNGILSPELAQGNSAPIPQNSFNAPLLGISRRNGEQGISDTVKVEAMEQLRKNLLHGKREQAIWDAVDNRMWAHAMLLSSSLDKSIWQQVVQEFVRQEVRTFGENTESLSALYQILAGNLDESIDELVPPSARAGLQMVSKNTTSGPTKNALDGLDRWRETLTLILSNRSSGDGQALVALGRLLAGYDRIEAAHICYLFAASPGLFGGPDNPQASVALLGADHLRHAFDYCRDFDSLLLTEVYDFVRTVLVSISGATASPHLQSFKLYHAMVLAEYGYKTEAQQYCDSITSALKSTTKPSPYYHALLFGALENVQDRLRQAPRDNSGSWISKPSMDKVSGSIWAKFNSYVAGDESDAGSTSSGRVHDGEAGPFARVAGDSPSLSRTPSSNDLYNAHSSGLGLAAATSTANPPNSRYAPNNLYTPRSSLDQPRRASHDNQRPQATESLRPNHNSLQYSSRPGSSKASNNDQNKATTYPSPYAPQTDNHLPTPPLRPQFLIDAPTEGSLYPPDQYHLSQPSESNSFLDQQQPTSAYEGSSAYGSLNTAEPTPSYYQPPSSYEAPSSNDYQPPAYEPPSMETTATDADPSPLDKRPNIDDDDDDFEKRAAALRAEERVRKDREADEAFKKAAEEDGK